MTSSKTSQFFLSKLKKVFNQLLNSKVALIALTFAFAISAKAQNQYRCEGLTPNSLNRYQAQVSKAASAIEANQVHYFFLGVWSKANRFDHQRISAAVKAGDTKMIEGIEKVQKDLGTRLEVDRQKFISWIQKNSLNQDIQLNETLAPELFIFFKANPFGIQRVLCASLKNEISSQFFENLGY